MKRLVPLAMSLLFALPAVASDDPFAAFRIPDHTWRSGLAQIQLAGGREAGGPTRYDAFTPSGDLALSHARDSDALQHSLRLALRGLVATQTQRDDVVLPGYLNRRDDFYRSGSEGWTVDAALRVYPWSRPLGFDLRASAAGDYV